MTTIPILDGFTVCLFVKNLTAHDTNGHLGPLHGKKWANGEAVKKDQEEGKLKKTLFWIQTPDLWPSFYTNHYQHNYFIIYFIN